MALEPAARPDADVIGSTDLERLCVAARAVVDGLPRLMDDGLSGGSLQTTTAHAVKLSDFDTLQHLPLADVHTHGSALRETLAQLGTDRALTYAVWFEDALGAH